MSAAVSARREWATVTSGESYFEELTVSTLSRPYAVVAPGWLPPDYPADRRIRICPAGRDWDAVRAPYYLGETALDQLGETCGAVIYDPRESALYWLVKAGATAGWGVPYTRPLGATQYLVVPAAVCIAPPGVHWLIPPGERLLTGVELLRDALLAAVCAHLGPREQAAQ